MDLSARSRTGVERAESPARPPSLPSLTGLRFFAALLVFFAHVVMPVNLVNQVAPVNPFANETIADGLGHWFGHSGYVGVSFFFVLSGFVLTWSRRPAEGVLAFWRRRLLKVFPNHLVVWALVMALFAAEVTPVRAWLPNLFLVHAFVPDVELLTSVNSLSWSLSCELLFYLLFPFLVRPLLRIPERLLWPAAGAAVAGVAAVSLLSAHVIPAGAASALGTDLDLGLSQLWFAYFFPPSRLFEFVLGVVLARLVVAGRWPRLPVPWVVALAVAGYVVATEGPAPYYFALATIVPVAAVIGAAATADLRGARTPLNRPVTIWLGQVSFAFYMVQTVGIFYLRDALFGTETYGVAAGTGIVVLLFGLNLSLGWLLYRQVEDPVMRRFGRSRRRTHRPA
ncbi:acyltransferase family protein [Streptomyces millisiae]|uniref:Acyltransferase n=1 Tax=Streptomyces millisiae TaxID=3075542 RepID=A0ABU2LIW6_9ACTN|nr:acyltransferase [Streptomyces sp. DSM 44918]MDT0317193.1 acyltransferase [Streptomyces sp. DSM 44918]